MCLYIFIAIYIIYILYAVVILYELSQNISKIRGSYTIDVIRHIVYIMYVRWR